MRRMQPSLGLLCCCAELQEAPLSVRELQSRAEGLHIPMYSGKCTFVSMKNYSAPSLRHRFPGLLDSASSC